MHVLFKRRALQSSLAYHTLILTKNNSYGFGYNLYGQLGNNNTTNQSEPVEVLISFRPKETLLLACGHCHTMIFTGEGILYAIGWNAYGQLGIGDNTNQSLPKPVTFFPPKRILWLTCGQAHTMVYTNEKKLYGFGYNAHGQLGVGHNNNCTSPVEVTFFTNKEVLLLDCGHHTLALTNENKLYAFGYNEFGQLGIGSKDNQNLPHEVTFFSNKKISLIKCGYSHTLVYTDKEKLYSFGNNAQGQLGISDITVKLYPVEIEFFRGKTISSLGCGYNYSIVIVDQGKVYGFGHNGSGQLGTGNTTNQPSPIELNLPNNTSSISCFAYHMMILTDDGKLFGMGYNPHGQLGIGNTTNQSTPVEVKFFSNKKIYDNFVPIRSTDKLESRIHAPKYIAKTEPVEPLVINEVAWKEQIKETIRKQRFGNKEIQIKTEDNVNKIIRYDKSVAEICLPKLLEITELDNPPDIVIEVICHIYRLDITKWLSDLEPIKLLNVRKLALELKFDSLVVWTNQMIIKSFDISTIAVFIKEIEDKYPQFVDVLDWSIYFLAKAFGTLTDEQLAEVSRLKSFLKIFSQMQNLKLSEPSPGDLVNPSIDFKSLLIQLWDSRKNTGDCQLITQDEIINVHTFVIASASPFFYDLLDRYSALSDDILKCRIVLEEPSSVFLKILEYFYKKDVSILSKRDLIWINKLANRYELNTYQDEFVTYCKKVTDMTPQNCSELIVPAIEVGERVLVENAIAMIKDTHPNNILIPALEALFEKNLLLLDKLKLQ